MLTNPNIAKILTRTRHNFVHNLAGNWELIAIERQMHQRRLNTLYLALQLRSIIAYLFMKIRVRLPP